MTKWTGVTRQVPLDTVSITQGEDWNDPKAMVRDAVLCHFDDTMPPPRLIRLHFVRDEVLLV